MLPVQPYWPDLCPSCVAAPEPDLVKVNIPDPGQDSDQAMLQPLLDKDQQKEALAEGKACLPLAGLHCQFVVPELLAACWQQAGAGVKARKLAPGLAVACTCLCS